MTLLDIKKRTIQFLKNRVSRKRFWGLPLTLLSISFAYGLLVFVEIAEDIKLKDTIVTTDLWLNGIVANLRTTELTSLFSLITNIADTSVMIVLSIAVVLVLIFLKKQTYILPFVLCMLGSTFFTQFTKAFFGRARPTNGLLLEDGFSFPSGHSTAAMAFFGFLAYAFTRAKSWSKKLFIFCIASIFIILIGFSRMYLGVHYLSDIIGGFIAGGIWLIIAIAMVLYDVSRNSK